MVGYRQRVPTLAQARPETAPAGVLGTIGNTPLVPLDRWRDAFGGPLVHLKLEGTNPGGSAKDRPAAAMVADAVERGAVDAGGTVVESSSGNMGIGLAQACRYFGLNLVCVVDHRSSAEKIATMRALGAEVEVITEPAPGRDLLATRIDRVAALCERIPGAWWPNQYENPSNPASHQRGTAREIHEALDRDPDYLLVATSTTGTLAGCRRYLDEIGAATELVAVDAAGSALFGGRRGRRRLPGLGAGVETAISATVAPDQLVRIGDLESVVGCRQLVAHEAIFAGASTGAVMAAAREIAPRIDADAVVAAISPDGGTSYLDTVYDDIWVEAELGLSSEDLAARVAGAQ